MENDLSNQFQARTPKRRNKDDYVGVGCLWGQDAARGRKNQALKRLTGNTRAYRGENESPKRARVIAKFVGEKGTQKNKKAAKKKREGVGHREHEARKITRRGAVSERVTTRRESTTVLQKKTQGRV